MGGLVRESGKLQPYSLDGLSLRLWWAQRKRFGPGWAWCHPLRRPYANLWYIVGGRMGVAIGTHGYTLKAGDLAILPAHVAAESWNAGEGELEYLSLGFECNWHHIDALMGMDPFLGPVQMEPEVVATWDRLDKETRGTRPRDSAQGMTVLGLLQLLLAGVMRCTGLDLLQGLREMDPRLLQAMAWMRGHLREPIRVEDVAREVHLSPGRLRDLFVQYTSRPFRDVLTRMRMQHAKALLVNSRLPISEIAQEVGYSDVHHFSRAFLRSEGVPPSRYRKRMTQDPSASMMM